MAHFTVNLMFAWNMFPKLATFQALKLAQGLGFRVLGFRA